MNTNNKFIYPVPKSKSLILLGFYLILGTIIGFLLFRFILPDPVPDLFIWLKSSWLLALMGFIGGGILFSKRGWVKFITVFGGLCGAILGHMLTLYLTLITGLLWYGFLNIKWPEEVSTFLGVWEFIWWVMAVVLGCLIGSMVGNYFRRRKGPTL